MNTFNNSLYCKSNTPITLTQSTLFNEKPDLYHVSKKCAHMHKNEGC